MTEFRAYRVHKKDKLIKGKIELLTLEDLSSGEVVIKSEYSSVNYKDALAATGRGKIIHEFPRVAGIDVAGRVVSSNDKRFQKGDAVLVTGYEFGTGHDGGYAEYARVPAEWVIPLPDGLSTYEAMAMGTAAFTVGLCVKRLEDNQQTPEKGPFVVTGATGGVGMFAIDILSKLGYEVIALTGKVDRADELKRLGAAGILERQSLKLDGPPLEKSSWGGAIDNVGGDILAWLTRTVVPWGNIASVGLAGGSQLNTTVMPFILRGVSLLGITSSGCPSDLRSKIWQRLASDLKPQHLDKIVTQISEMEQLPGIFDDMLDGKSHGRTVIKLPGSN
jgi:acrylyl-CoA reductase (NADPH)